MINWRCGRGLRGNDGGSTADGRQGKGVKWIGALYETVQLKQCRHRLMLTSVMALRTLQQVRIECRGCDP